MDVVSIRHAKSHAGSTVPTILVVDDDRTALELTVRMLRVSGFEVITAERGDEALRLIAEMRIQLVVTDWLMPGLDGAALCRRLRAPGFGHYVYIILVTGMSEESDAALLEGLTLGADDFIRKPVRHEELTGRVTAGIRTLRMESELVHRNEHLSARNRQLRGSLAEMTAELRLAAAVQRSLLPNAPEGLEIDAAWLFRPSGPLGGDMLNYFRLDERRLGFYLMDAAGHGVTAALQAIAVAHLLHPGNGLVKRIASDESGYKILDPGRVLQALNARLLEMEADAPHCTLIYGVLDMPTGDLRYAVAGHPTPLMVTAAGDLDVLKTVGGPPVGLFPAVPYASEAAVLKPGDWLVLYSDGVIDCENAAGTRFGVERLETALRQAGTGRPQDLVDAVSVSLDMWRTGSQRNDDATLFCVGRPVAWKERAGE